MKTDALKCYVCSGCEKVSDNDLKTCSPRTATSATPTVTETPTEGPTEIQTSPPTETPKTEASTIQSTEKQTVPTTSTPTVPPTVVPTTSPPTETKTVIPTTSLSTAIPITNITIITVPTTSLSTAIPTNESSTITVASTTTEASTIPSTETQTVPTTSPSAETPTAAPTTSPPADQKVLGITERAARSDFTNNMDENEDAHEEGSDNLRCVFTVFEVNGVTNVVRGCSEASDDEKIRCREAVGADFNSSEIFCNLCQEDGCNTSTRATLAYVLLVFSTVFNFV
ncbi:hypothetical protein evm_003000 [Chilo suppressalis]|nr:hypothetical protein evm_003000 [Chilo suppressalis]